MSSKAAQDIVVDTIDETAIAEYLQQAPDFFERHPQLLTRLRLTHPRSGGTVSLIERQVEVLRERYAALESKLTEFVRVAQANEQLVGKIHAFTCRLLRTRTRAEALAEIEISLRRDFDTMHIVLVMPGVVARGDAGHMLRAVDIEDANYKSFEHLFASGKPRCGQVRDSQRSFLFGSEAETIGSLALVPVMSQSPPVLLALGSVDRERFTPTMSTEFLARMGEIIVEAIARH